MRKRTGAVTATYGGDVREVAVESSLGEANITALRAKGHDIRIETPDQTHFGFGRAQVITKTKAGYVAGYDPRKDGCAIGF